MSGAVCPSCGVAVVPGYVRCPKCRKPLPQRPAGREGGTAIERAGSRVPAIAALVGAVVVIGGVVAFFVLEKDEPAPAKAAAPTQTDETSGAETETVNTPDQTAETQPSAPKGPDPVDIAANLERELKKQRLWATVSIIGARAEVRSSSCSDPAMAPMLDGAAPAFKGAGLTKLRCVEQSGRVVSDRDL